MDSLLAISVEQACRLTGLSKRQLRYWDETGFFSPTLIDEGGRAFGRIYSFRDIVGLRVIANLRQKVSLQALRQTAEWLGRHSETPWSSLRIYVDPKNEVYFSGPGSGQAMRAGPGEQGAFKIALEVVASDVSAAAKRMSVREKNQIGRIEKHRSLVHSTPVIAGTRIPTSAVWNFKRAGYSAEAIVREYPRLTVKDVRSAIAFERKQSRRRAS